MINIKTILNEFNSEIPKYLVNALQDKDLLDKVEYVYKNFSDPWEFWYDLKNKSKSKYTEFLIILQLIDIIYYK